MAFRGVKRFFRSLREGAEDLRKLRELVEEMRHHREFTDNLLRSYDRHIRILVQQSLWSSVRAAPEFSDPKRLLSAGFKVYSQGMEDGIIAEIFRRIGTTSRRFIEFGIQDGLECNTAYLLIQGWSGAWIEYSPQDADRARANFKDYKIEVVTGAVTTENADAMMSRLAGDSELDLLSIDIDFNDYWVWDAIRTIKPRLVVIEYNATLPPSLRKTVAPNSDRFWDYSNYGGASLGALEALGRKKGYSLVGCSPTGVNAFFVRDDLVGDHFAAPFTAENHYQPPRYALDGPSGHRPGMGPWIDV